ncbi:MAG: metallophosphoesterase [Nanoarchaeota archaeon]
MKINNNIEIMDLALYLKKEKTLIIGDLHIGIEESLNKRGVLIPRSQFNDLLTKLKLILNKAEVSRVVFNGDLKHEFGEISRQEWDNILSLIDFLDDKEIVIIKGNHDPILKPIADKRNIKLVESYDFEDVTILHGDKILTNLNKTIIIGHEHPAISLKKGIRQEKYPCFLKGKYNDGEIIAMPSFNPLTYGTNVLKEKLLSPFLTNIENFEVFILEPSEDLNILSEALYFGKIKELRKLI